MKEKIKNILEGNEFAGMEVLENAMMSDYTTYKIGGPADYLVFPEEAEQLHQLILKLRELVIPFFILGEGSNILVSDSGIKEVVISLKKCTAEIYYQNEDEIIAGAGTLLMDVVKYAEQQEISGLGCLSGIPGTVGGALIMNAGAFGGEIGDHVKWVQVIDEQNEIIKLWPEQIEFGYRRAPGLKNKIVLSVLLKEKYEPGIRKKLENSREEYLKKRENKQPLNYGSCGSVFKRPEGNYAGALIEQAGCKGLRIGNAMVAQKHANFILNMGQAKAMDVFQIIKEIRKRVYEKFGVELQPEVKFIGEFPEID
ncbi:MAG: UDP-N-acetylmuramate dehydrogenase [Calditrichia bacterium]|nr:UDP-N-acetylmuramate dehydrogenase [Calditrichia bacterium]